MPLDGEQLGFLEKVIKIINKYGIFKVFQALCVIGIFVYLMYNAHNVGQAVQNIVRTEFENHNEKVEQEHNDALIVRQKIKPKIDSILTDALTRMNADRVFVMEMHNGNNNTSGLPFLYGEMTYEQVRNGVSHIDDDYINLNLSRFTFPLYLEREHLWQGTTEELSKIDDKLSKRLLSNDVSYLAITQIHGFSNIIGYFGVSYCNDKSPIDKKQIIAQLTITTQQLSVILDANNVVNNTKKY